MIKIYYLDNDIVVCEKPYGVSSQKSSGENMVDTLSEQLNSNIYPVHRLDTTTTGIMVFAKTEKSAALLSKQISDRQFNKEYLLICHGRVDKNGEMRDFLYHDRIKNKSFVVKNKRSGSKEALLEYETLYYSETKDLSLVKVILHTGRTHQIRVQFSSRGHALYGDGKYGARDNAKIALHSHSVAFFNIVKNEKNTFASYPESEIFTEISKEQAN